MATSSNQLKAGGRLLNAVSTAADWTSDAIDCENTLVLIIHVSVAAGGTLAGTLYVKGNTRNDTGTYYAETWLNSSGDTESSKSISGASAQEFVMKIKAPSKYCWVYLDQSSGTGTITVDAYRAVYAS